MSPSSRYGPTWVPVSASPDVIGLRAIVKRLEGPHVPLRDVEAVVVKVVAGQPRLLHLAAHPVALPLGAVLERPKRGRVAGEVATLAVARLAVSLEGEVGVELADLLEVG